MRPLNLECGSLLPLSVRARVARAKRRQAAALQSAGFTLIELTISAAVASVILTASYLCLNAGVATQKLIEPRTEVLQSARVALAMMSADLRSACSLSPDFDFVGEQRALGEMEADNLDFATHFYTPARPGEGDYCQVSYFVDKTRGAQLPDTQRFSLWRRRNPHLAPDPLSGGSREEIVRGLRGLTLEYYDGLDWYDTWGDASVKKKVKYTTTPPPNQSGFPEAVRITLLLDPNPDKSTEKAEPPLVFQTVVRLELADVAAAGGSSAAPDNSDGGSDAGQPGQNPGGGMN
ncbi:MAG: prepilin-type N-terminal cleavage/methylation domain-containing protein [Verrucomicrobiota bacterium]